MTLHYPPYIYEESGSLKGVAVEIIQEVFSRMNQPINISVLPWARAIKQIQSNQADGIFTIYKTEDREKFVDFSLEPLLNLSCTKPSLYL